MGARVASLARADAEKSSAAPVLYLLTCDKLGRDAKGDPAVAGKGFLSRSGQIALPWGCGQAMLLDLAAPRWLVVEATKADPEGGAGRVYEGQILFDGDREGAVRYLAQNGAGGLPHLGRTREAGDYAVLATGAIGHLKAAESLIAAAGVHARVEAADYALVSLGADGRARAGQRATIAGSDRTKAIAGDFAAVVLAQCGQAAAGQGSVVVGGAQSRLKGGTGSIVVGGACSVLDVGEWSLAVGGHGSRFRGKEGARLVCASIAESGLADLACAVIGVEGLLADTWYELDGERPGKFKACALDREASPS